MNIGKTALVGPGAVGGYYGAMLAQAGFDIRFLFRSTYESVTANGLWLVHHTEGSRKSEVQNLQPYRRAESVGECEWVVIASKATANRDLQKVLTPLVGEKTKFLTLQNGMGNVESLATQFGANRTILAGLCFTCINRTSPNVIESLLPGYVQFGQFGGKMNEDCLRMVAAFKESGVRVRSVDSLDEALWRKLCWNVPFNGLAIAGGGITTDLILADQDLTRRARALMLEVQKGAAAYGIEIEDAFIDRQFELTEPMGAYKPSSLLDYLKGKPVELNAIWGEALKRGQSKGVNMPELNLLLTQLEDRVSSK
jgi:2-dehydropantoate 2-reductase